MSSWNHSRISIALSWLLVSIFGVVEGLYGRTQYLGDWLCYLNVSRAVSSLDWRGIFDPMWNAGYPILVALARSVFPRTAEGEWYAITLLNWIIFLGAYAALRYLVRQAIAFYDPLQKNLASNSYIIWIICGVFLSFDLSFDKVSRVSPDLLVSTLFILAAAQTLRILTRPSVKAAVALGLILGAGCWVKGVFVSYSGIFLLMLFLACIVRKMPLRILATSVVIYLVVFIPYIAGISWSYGQFTLGASGSLNYAFHVNHLPHWTNWEGGPSQFGRPLHASQQLLDDQPVFAFGAPFRTTYPPYNNMAYWYQGFRHFFSFKLQLIAIGRSLHALAGVVRDHPFLCMLVLVFLALLLKRDWRISARKVFIRFWPLALPATLGLSTYVLVHVEDRYLGCFFLVFSLLPLTLLLDSELKPKRTFLIFILAAYALGAAAELAVNLRPTLKAAIHGQDFRHDSQWQLAQSLKSYGLASGDAVALVGNSLPNYRCSWAYVSGVRIVAEYGSVPWQIEPWDRMHSDHIKAEQADKDYGQIFWELPSEQRARVVQAFQTSGARAILSLSQPASPPEAGWRRLGETGAWIYNFDPQLAASN